MNRLGDNLKQLWRDDPLLPYYNTDGLTDVVLTCDIDWAPEYAIEYVMDLVSKYGCKMTMFTTHRSSLLLNAPDFIEVALHPDFTRTPNLNGFSEKMTQLKDIYPDAVGTRSHRNFFGQNIADIAKKCELKYDASVFLWNQPLCQSHTDYNGMTRHTYMWEDGIHLDMGFDFDWSKISLHTPGMKIINVHPILIYLNSISDNHRRSVTSRYKDLTSAPKAEIDVGVNRAFGIKDFWERLLQYIQSSKIRTHCLKDLPETESR